MLAGALHRRPRAHRHARALTTVLGLALGLGAALGGCGSPGKSSIPLLDCDGTHLMVFESGRILPAGQQNILLYDLDAGGFRAMVGFGSTGQDRRAAITADGKAIAVERTGPATGQDVLVYDRCSGGFLDRPELITSADETEPAFSGDTQELAFVRDTLGVRRIRLYDGYRRRFNPLHLLDSLAAHGFDSQSPTLDRTGGIIAFVSGTSPTRDIWLYSRAGDSLYTVLSKEFDTPNDETDPWLTPDARYLAFASDRPGGEGLYDIYLYDLQAHAYVPVDSLNSAGNDIHPTMSPDAVFMAFQSDRTPLLKWDVFNYNRTLHLVSQSFQESSSEDDTQPYVAWP